MINFNHIPVLLNEAVQALQINNGEVYIDATAGGGGHIEEIVKRGGKVMGIDQDADAIVFLKEKFENNKNITIEHDNFAHLKFLANKNKIASVMGVLFDLGVSSYQIDNSRRGFSFKRDEKLDMRMGSGNLTAAEVVNTWTKGELTEIFQRYGEEHNANTIAESIVDRRKQQKFENSKDLADVISKVSHSDSKIHPATLVFQALRIVVNNELESEKEGLSQAMALLGDKGRIVVISFHSLEDRIVKQQFLQWERKGMGKIITKKPIMAREDETQKNKRARSAKMRIFERKKLFKL